MRIGVTHPRARTLLRRLCIAGLRAADPAQAVSRYVRRAGDVLQMGGRSYDLNRFGRIFAVGAGKASAGMALTLERLLGRRLEGGLVVVKYGQAVPTKRIKFCEAGHPVPDQAGQRAGARLLGFVRHLTAEDLLIVLLSGGASSLLPAPVPGVTLSDKRRITQQLLKSGADIQEINTVRKHLSMIKGGRLAAATRARVASLILSDVIGNDLGSIGSGPTAPDPATYREACAILQRYELWDKIPKGAKQHLHKGRQGRIAETPKPGDAIFRRVQNHLIGDNVAAVTAVAQEAREAGLATTVLSTTLTGEAREMARQFAGAIREIVDSKAARRRPCCVIAGGELTVTVRGKGRGGRAQEFALAAALEIAGLENVWVAGFATDGVDGPTDVAGAVVDGGTVARARRLGLDLRHALDQNDSYGIFKKLGNHIVTGPTGTNVNDLYILLAL